MEDISNSLSFSSTVGNVPKLEPLDFHLPSSIPILPKTLTLKPHFPTRAPFVSLPPNIADEHRRLSHFLSSLPSSNPNLNPNPSSALVPSNPNVRKRPHPRPSELHRVTAIAAGDESLIRANVRRTRILYESIRTRLMQEDEISPPPTGKRSRADLNAATVMGDLWINRDVRTVGFLPGVHIGDVFFYRMELVVLGIHGQVQAGIDFVTAKSSPSGEPIATSIIVSGGYEDDDDRGEVLVYTGHGGREGKNETRHCVDQKLEGGNLALERSHCYGIEIRVVRGMDCDRSPTNRVYVYDGLYKVVDRWSEMGRSGFKVYKFKLERLAGQEEMGSAVIRRVESLKLDLSRVTPDGYLNLDISKGKEKMPVSLFNCIDDDRLPLSIDYLVRPVFSSYVKRISGGGCRCRLSCELDCECVKRNGGELPYDANRRLLRGKPIVFECGKNCKCPPSCANRVSQNGLRHRLEIFRSMETGWGVRSLDFIQAGEFVCEFSGILLMKEELEKAIAHKGVSLVNPNMFPKRWEEWGDLSKVRSDYKKPVFPPLHEVGYSIDVSCARNVACYLSHSCNPNVFVQFVEFDQYNGRFPHVMIFTMENIPPMRELSLDYGVGEV